MSDTPKNARNVSVDVLANIFAAENSVVPAEVGEKNTDEKQGTIYYAMFPADDLANYAARRQFINNNWDGARHGYKGLSVADKLAKAGNPDPKVSGFEPSEPTVLTLLQKAVQNILVRKNADQLAGMTESQLITNMAPFVAQVLNDPARTEAYRPLIEAEIAAIRAWSAPRPRKQASEPGSGLAINLD